GQIFVWLVHTQMALMVTVITRYRNAQPSGGITLPPPVTLDFSPGTGSNSNGFGGNLLGCFRTRWKRFSHLIDRKENRACGFCYRLSGGWSDIKRHKW
uniref:Uncharacterized protein n=1 Tax=Takifugu rubripes TaxID=31033 RepID=A0A3B5KCL8_TAKRU